METWKTVNDFEAYEVSNTGKVRSKSTFKGMWGRELKSSIWNGYKRITLRKDNKANFRSIHRLVGIHFIFNPYNYPVINHLDGDKLNNNDWNLEWTTQKANITHAEETGLRNSKGIKNKAAKLTDEQALAIRNDKRKTRYIIAEYGISSGMISKIRTKKNWKHL